MPVPNPQMPQPPAGAMPPLPAFPGKLGIVSFFVPRFINMNTAFCSASHVSHRDVFMPNDGFKNFSDGI